MGKKTKYIIKVVIFPITIVFYLIKWIYSLIDKKIARIYIDKLDINSIDSLDGLEFEEFLYYYIKSLGIRVEKTQKSRDYGADLVIKLKQQKLVIQTKLYYNHNVGNSAVQEIAGAKKYYQAESGVVITNSFFTKSACALAESNNIRLMDRIDLTKFLSSDKYTQRDIISSWLICE